MAKTVKAFVRVGRTDYEVKVVSTFTTGDHRKVAVVEALPVNGRKVQPFTHYSIGGPYTSDTANVRVDFLKGLSIIDEPEPQEAPAPVLGIVNVNGQDVEVEVKKVYTSVHGEQIAEVQARPINGRQPTPFINYSISRGNPMTSTTRIPISQIMGLSLVEMGRA